MHKDIQTKHLLDDITLDVVDQQEYAYTVGEKATANKSLSTLFPSGFPYNFSLLMKMKVASEGKGYIVAIQDQQYAFPWFAIRVDGDEENIQKILMQFQRKKQVIIASVKVPVFQENQWNSLGLSVTGNLLSFYWNCVLKSTQSVARDESVPTRNSKLFLASSGTKRRKSVKVTFFELIITERAVDAAAMCTHNNTQTHDSSRAMASTVHAIGSHHGKPPAPTEKMSASASWECPKGDKCYSLKDPLSEPLIVNGKKQKGKSSSAQRGQPGLPGSKGVRGPRGISGMKGDKGEIGDTGADGPIGGKGMKGDKGEHGLPGVQGLLGDKGERGPMGPPGKKGEQGKNGAMGLQGSRGHPGVNGVPGTHGQKGEDGKPGLQGVKGTKGDKGIGGPMGRPGVGQNGEKGSKGLKGGVGPVGPIGRKGSVGSQGPRGFPGPPGPPWKGSRSALIELINVTSMAAVSGIKGEKGDKGDGIASDVKRLAALSSSVEGVVSIPTSLGTQGLPGLKGERGRPGPQGPPGPKGERGIAGRPGLFGAPGDKGDVGDKGEPGVARNGLPGLDGRDGEKGVKGEAGAPGLNGAPGLIGKRGIRGPFGPKGESGIRGLPGPPGPPGESSHSSGQGIDIVVGPPGEKGQRGTPGISVKGERGTKGDRGQAGPQGQPGPPGISIEASSESSQFADMKVGKKGDRGFGLEIVSSQIELSTIDMEGSIVFRRDMQRLYVLTSNGIWKAIPFMEEISESALVTQPGNRQVSSVSGSSSSETKCGDGEVQPGEECDGRNFGGQTCQDLHGETSLGELICSSNCHIDMSRCQPSSVMLIALNSLHNGSLGGLTGADKICQDAARDARIVGTFKAFLSGRDRSILSLVSKHYRRLPVVNIKRETLYISWEILFSGQTTVSYSPHHLSFNGQSPPKSDLWVGSFFENTKSENTCFGWQSRSRYKSGRSSSLQRQLSSQRSLSCDKNLSVLCVLAI
ncbi:collagen alpha-1(XI) chain-like isoform X2 [Corticium candelabrum]|uniref:collagen alpha-1(XI) chain-like isoform X2 n=1 Tax=Corticium candelabrum TaxID=121492 RepID=UPI002E2698D9|nr:collagen alpha-1(XI) chain-like isoform X2 [Corticium candelabrum]